MVLTTSLGVALAALISYSNTERRLNVRHELHLEAKNAAEAVTEYGFAQLRYMFENRTSFPVDALNPANADALVAPPVSVLGPNVDASSIELIGGSIPPFPTSLTYFDPNDPEDEFDPLKGKMVRAREIAVYGKATVNPSNGGKGITQYVSQRLQVRDASLFAHAIFYNLDLELHPGPKMDVYGPVHTNENLYIQAVDRLRFHGQTTAAEDMLRGWAYKPASQGGSVQWKDRNGDFQPYDHDGIFHDSKMGTSVIDPTFRSYASNRWHGNLQTSMHGIEDYVPVAFSEYQPDDPTTPVYDPVNSGRAIIEPTLPITHPDYNSEIEDQKMASKAGLRLVWDSTVTDSSNVNAVKAYKSDGTEVDISELNADGELWKIRNDVMYDHRRSHDVTIADINVGKLKQLIENPNTADPNLHIGGYDPANDWNGIVYFETRSGNGDPELNESGIRLYGGDTNETNQGIPSRGLDPGMTFATNNVLYIRGNFNADGQLHQSSDPNHSAQVPEGGEVPVAVMGDAVTFLSGAWDDSDTSVEPDAVNTEVAVAIVSGLLPSNSRIANPSGTGNGKGSGGAHNFPRFLESWKNKDFFIRGSIVSLYEAEVDTSTFSTDYYDPPRRKWGFSNQYRDGVYPPGTPLLRLYRRVDYRELSKAEYDAAIAALPWNATP